MHGLLARGLATTLSVLSLIGSCFFCTEYGDDLIASAEKLKPTAAAAVESSSSEAVSVPKSRYTLVSVESFTPSKEETAPVSAERAAGKIISQYFDPTTANTKWEDIYVNNQSGEKINIEKLLNLYTPGIKETKQPQVLIVHTHATENYVMGEKTYKKSEMERTADPTRNVIGVGNEVERVLKKAGIEVIHDKTLHDDPSYSGSYNRSAATVEKYLKKHPSIKIVLDIHRDAIGDGDDLIKPVTKVQGRNAAQVMICVGSNTGSVDYYPAWQNNLSVGLKLQQTLETLYPGLARPLYLAYDRCWNQNLCSGSLIIEFGTNGNSFPEAKYSATLVANALVATLK